MTKQKSQKKTLSKANQKVHFTTKVLIFLAYFQN